MSTERKLAVWLAVLLLLAVGLWLTLSVIRKQHRITLRGVVLRQDSDPSKQVPIADANISAITGNTVSQAKSDESGLFSVTLPRGFRRRQPITLQFQHQGYQPLELSDFISDKLYVARMKSIAAVRLADGRPAQVISNVRLRYVVRTTETADVGSAVKNISGDQHRKCSLQEAKSLLTRRQVESGNSLHIA